MRWPTIVIALSLTCAAAARAGDPCSCWGLSWPWSTERKPCCNCPDDYCRKPMPCVQPLKWCSVDDYCRKPMPCVQPLKWCGVDDYCRKPCTIWLPHCYPAWYTCVPAGNPNACANTSSPSPTVPGTAEAKPSK